MLTKEMGKQFYFYPTIDSTNVQAKRLSEEGAGHGTVVVADMQTAGRGRRGREWSSPAGKNLYFSLLLKPDFAPDKASMLTLVMAMAVVKGIERALQQISLEEGKDSVGNDADFVETFPEIKWPNDLCVDGRKICGILTEMAVEQGRISHVIIGVGVNVEQQEFAPELAHKATSLETEYEKNVPREALLEKIMEAFEQVYEVFCQTCDMSLLKEEYNAKLVNCGREVCVLDPKGEFSGIARGINDEGELLVERADGSVTAVYAGEVSVRGIYGYV